MCDNSCTENCKNKRCNSLRALARLETIENVEKKRYGRFSYNSGFITQLMSQQNDTSSTARRNRKTPHVAISTYEENQAVIAGDHLAIFAKVS